MPEYAATPLRAVTYLSPGIPFPFFELVTRYLARVVGREPFVERDERISGPMHGDHDPFADGGMDLGFLCSPSYLYLRALEHPSVELLPVGFVFRDSRNQGRPLYFSDVIVRADRGDTRLEDLAGATFGFNDTCSLSGYFAAKQELASRGLADGFFGTERCTGSHAASIQAVLNGEVDVAAIDSNVLALAELDHPGLRSEVRIIESWGPHPIQPVVLSTRTHAELGEALRAALLDITSDTEFGPLLSPFGLERCVPIDDTLYANERAALEGLGHL